jgi:hypothetical protein
MSFVPPDRVLFRDGIYPGSGHWIKNRQQAVSQGINPPPGDSQSGWTRIKAQIKATPQPVSTGFALFSAGTNVKKTRDAQWYKLMSRKKDGSALPSGTERHCRVLRGD